METKKNYLKPEFEEVMLNAKIVLLSDSDNDSGHLSGC